MTGLSDTVAPDSATRRAAKAPPRWPRLWGRATATLLLLGGLLTAYRMAVVHFSGISLFFDEAQYWDWSRHLAWGYYSKPPAIAALVAMSTALWGDGVLGVKALAMLTYLATSLAMVGLARALWPTGRGVRTGVVAGALLITAPMTGLLGMAASTDGPLMLCWTLASWALWRAQVTDRLGLWCLCGVAVGLGLLSKYTMAAFAFTALWTLWGVQGPGRGLFRWGPWVTIATALLVLSPNIAWNVQWQFPTLQHTADITTQSGREGGPLALLTFLAGQVLMVGPLALGAALWLRRTAAPARGSQAAPSQWAASSQIAPSTQQPATSTGAGADTVPSASSVPATRGSAYHLASVTSHRYVLAMSLPLLAMAAVQSLRAGAHVNWAAPALVGVFLWMASRLSAPLAPPNAPHRLGWFWASVALNLLLTAAVVHTRDLVGPTLPGRLDALVRMRGWHEAFAQLAPLLKDPRVSGLPLVADKRLLLSQASYEWRHEAVNVMAWNPGGTRHDHYQLHQSLPDEAGQDVLVLSDQADPAEVLNRFAFKKELGRARVQVASDRTLDLRLFLARGFMGYERPPRSPSPGAPSAP